MTGQETNVIELHDRLTVVLSPRATRLIREEIARQRAAAENWRQLLEAIHHEMDRQIHEPGLQMSRFEDRARREPQTAETLVNNAIELLYSDDEHELARVAEQA